MRISTGRCFKMTGLVLLCCFMGILGRRQAAAIPVAFNFEAQALGVVDSTGFFGSTFGVGSIISGTFTFDANAPDIDPYPGDGYQRYASNGAGFGFSFVAGSRSFTPIEHPDLPELMIQLINKTDRDFYNVHSQTITTLGMDPFLWSSGDNFIGFELELPPTALDENGIPLNLNELVESALNSSFDLDVIIRDLNNGNFLGTAAVRGQVISITGPAGSEAPIPEPASVLLLSTGLGAIGLRGLIKRK